MRTLVLVVSVLLATSPTARALPTAQQRAWFDRLSPEEAGKVLQAYEDQLRMERWDAVTRVAVTDMVRTADIVLLNPTEVIGWNVRVARGEKVKVWWAIETPRRATTPFDVKVQWFHERAEMQSKVLAITNPSPVYRLWDTMTMKRPGTWTIVVSLADGSELARRTLYVD